MLSSDSGSAMIDGSFLRSCALQPHARGSYRAYALHLKVDERVEDLAPVWQEVA